MHSSWFYGLTFTFYNILKRATKKNSREQVTFMNYFFCGGLSGTLSLGVTYANDISKVMYARLATLTAAERFQELYRGFPIDAGKNFVYFGILFGVYEYLLGHVIPKPENSEKHSVVSKFGAAFVAEKSGSLLMDPISRYRIQTHSPRPKVRDWAKKVFTESGISGFYQSGFFFRPRGNIFAIVIFSELNWYFFREQ
jgi:hypothetical protein